MSESANPLDDVTASIAVDTTVRRGSPDPAAPDLVRHGSALVRHGSPDSAAPRSYEAWLIVLCLVCDFLMVPVFSSINGPSGAVVAPIALGILGCVLAQGNLLAAWLAWSDGPFLGRLAKHWIIAAGLYLIWVFGLTFADEHEVLRIAQVVGLGVPLVSIAAQFPLWLARQWLGWRLVREPAEAAPREPPLAIRDLMVATLVVATSLALARLAPSPDAGSVWPVWAVAFAIATVISSLALLPAGALLLRMQPFRRGLAWSCFYAGAWIALPWIIAAVLRVTGTVMLPPLAIFVGISSLMFTFAAALILSATIARNRGYRLTGGRKRLSHLRQES